MTDYDVVLYPGRAQVNSHPRRSATLARLLGFDAALPSRCRVLELGCSNGLNLAAMAVALPESEFVGVDLSKRSIALGRELLAEAGIRNVKLIDASFTELGAELGEFDYVIAHGLYSWLPAESRDALLDTFRRFLSENGVGYVSYAVYPGCHLRELTRGMMLFHTREIEDPLEKVREGVRFVQFARQHGSAPDAFREVLDHERSRFADADIEYVYHDDFSSENSPVYFSGFVDHLRSRDLDFLSESTFSLLGDPSLSREARRALAQLAGDDVVAREQYLDFFRGRAFRQSLICRGRPKLSREPVLDRVFSLEASTSLTPSEGLDRAACRDREPRAFRSPRGAEITIAEPALKVALSLLAEQKPLSVPVSALWDRTSAELPEEDRDHEGRALFARALLQGAAIRAVELEIEAPRFAREPGERPIASPLARVQARSGIEITDLTHRTHHIEDERIRRVISLLDGRRTRAELAEAMDHDSLSSGDLEGVLRELGAEALLVE